MQIKNASAVVTGGGSGLGAATARALADAGAHVVILDLESSPGAEVAAEIGGTFSPGDVTSDDSVRQAVAAASAAGPLRVVVNCAGIATPGRLVDRDGHATLGAFQRVIDINVVGTARVSAEGAAAMRAAGRDADGNGGLIVNTASVAAFDGQVGQGAYAASKGAVASMTLPLAREFARDGIRVVTIAPGIMETPMMKGLPEAAQASLAEQIPNPSRLGRPDEYANLVLAVASNDYLNGETIRLDGAIRMAPK